MKPLLVGRSYELLFSPDERTAIALGPALVLWDLESRGREVIGRPFRYLAHAALSPDGARLAVVNTSGKLAMLDARTLTAVWQADFGFGEGSNLVWLADGSAFVVGSWDGTIAIVERDEPKLRARDDAPNRMVRRIARRGASEWVFVEMIRGRSRVESVVVEPRLASRRQRIRRRQLGRHDRDRGARRAEATGSRRRPEPDGEEVRRGAFRVMPRQGCWRARLTLHVFQPQA